MTSAAIHHGAYSSIPSNSSPGLLFLKSFLSVVDSLDANTVRTIADLVHPDATSAVNNNDASRVDLLPMLLGRIDKLAKFEHELHTAWDIAKDEEGGRTVLYESTSVTVFKGDANNAEARVKEFSIIELSQQKSGEFRAISLKTYMDMSPVVDRARALAAGG